jgi:nitroreductase
MELDEAIKQRHSVRRYSTKKPNYEQLAEILEAANSAPLAGNIPTIKFIVVTDTEKIKKIANACQQDHIEKVDMLIVVCSDNTQILRSYGKRGEKYSRQQAGAVIENALLKITDLGLASCWTGAFADEMIRNVLTIPDNIEVEAVLPIGYEMPKASKQRKKRDLDWVLFFNKWKEKRLKPWKTPEAM